MALHLPKMTSGSNEKGGGRLGGLGGASVEDAGLEGNKDEINDDARRSVGVRTTFTCRATGTKAWTAVTETKATCNDAVSLMESTNDWLFSWIERACERDK